MRKTAIKASGENMSTKASHRAMKLAAIVLGIGLVLTAAPVDAADDDEEEGKTFERGVIDNIMSSLGGRRIEDGTIKYRERSPLVIPSRTDLPPPTTGKSALAPNWPKDPDEAERKRAKLEASKSAMSPEEARRPLMPSELAAKTPRGSGRKGTSTSNNPSDSGFMLSPSQLGYSGGLFSNAFGSGKPETATFEGEPERTELTEPPKGYQTPSSNYAYGVGASKGMEMVCDSASGQCEKRERK